MPCLKKQVSFFCLLLFCFSLPSTAKEINIADIKMSVEKDYYALTTNIEYSLNEETLKALEHGIGLNFEIEINLFEQKKRWFETSAQSKKINYILEFHTLTNQYILSNIDTGIRKSFSSLEPALYQIGRLNNLPLWKQSTINENMTYYISIKSIVEIRSLPAPLRPLFYLIDKWQMRSDEVRQEWQP